jgi:hypothetical protein
MKRVLSHRPSPAMIVAVIALVVAASGTAIAAGSLVSGDSLIKQRSLSGNRLRNHTLTGKQINLAKLGKVPSAHTADVAANANQLGGQSPSAYASAGGLSYMTPTLLSGWTNGATSAAQFAKDPFGVVHLRGSLANGTGVAFVLPDGFRPPSEVIESVWTPFTAGAVWGELIILTTGQVIPEGTNAKMLTSLDGVTFSAQ